MTDLTKLQSRIEQMLSGEKKRREVALKFIDEVTDIVKDIAPVIFSSKETAATYVNNSVLYFRWDNHAGRETAELPGFYFDTEHGNPYWGDPLEDQYGPRFWGGIRTIIEWLPTIIDRIDEKEASRDKLIALLK